MSIVPHGAPSALPWTGAELDQAVTDTDRAWTRHAFALAILWQAHDSAPLRHRARYQQAIHRHQAGIARCEHLQRAIAATTHRRTWGAEA